MLFKSTANQFPFNEEKMTNNNLKLSPNEKILYYKPSFFYNRFQTSTDHLFNKSQLGESVSSSWNTMPTGGTTIDDQGFI
jgi:hypothetical protein